jgi:hypothetical protein
MDKSNTQIVSIAIQDTQPFIYSKIWINNNKNNGGKSFEGLLACVTAGRASKAFFLCDNLYSNFRGA